MQRVRPTSGSGSGRGGGRGGGRVRPTSGRVRTSGSGRGGGRDDVEVPTIANPRELYDDDDDDIIAPTTTSTPIHIDVPFTLMATNPKYIEADNIADLEFPQFVLECFYHQDTYEEWKNQHTARDQEVLPTTRRDARLALRASVDDGVNMLKMFSPGSMLDEMLQLNPGAIHYLFKKELFDARFLSKDEPEKTRAHMFTETSLLINMLVSKNKINTLHRMRANDIKRLIIVADFYRYTILLEYIARCVDDEAYTVLLETVQKLRDERKQPQLEAHTFLSNEFIAGIFCNLSATNENDYNYEYPANIFEHYKLLFGNMDIINKDDMTGGGRKPYDVTPTLSTRGQYGGQYGVHSRRPLKFNTRTPFLSQMAKFKAKQQRAQRGGAIDDVIDESLINRIVGNTYVVEDGVYRSKERETWYDTKVFNIMYSYVCANTIAYVLNIVPKHESPIDRHNNLAMDAFVRIFKKEVTPFYDEHTMAAQPPARFWYIFRSNLYLNTLPSMIKYVPDGASFLLSGDGDDLVGRFTSLRFQGNVHLFSDPGNTTRPKLICDKIQFSYEHAKQITLDNIYVEGTLQFNVIFDKNKEIKTALRKAGYDDPYKLDWTDWNRTADSKSRITVQNCLIGINKVEDNKTLTTTQPKVLGRLLDVRALVSLNLAHAHTQPRVALDPDIPPQNGLVYAGIGDRNLNATDIKPINYDPVIYKRAFLLNNVFQVNRNRNDVVCVRSGNGMSTLMMDGNTLTGSVGVVKYVGTDDVDDNAKALEEKSFVFTNNTVNDSMCALAIVQRFTNLNPYHPKYTITGNTFIGPVVHGVVGWKLPSPVKPKDVISYYYDKNTINIGGKNDDVIKFFDDNAPIYEYPEQQIMALDADVRAAAVANVANVANVAAVTVGGGRVKAKVEAKAKAIPTAKNSMKEKPRLLYSRL